MNWTGIELFWTEFKDKSKRVWVPPTKKGKELQNFVCHDMEKAQFLLFSTRGHSTLSELTLNWVQKSLMVSWAEFKFSFWPMNWTWIDHQIQGKNWIELKTSIQFWTAIQLWIYGSLSCYLAPSDSRWAEGRNFKTSTVGPSEYTSRIIGSSAKEVSIPKDWKSAKLCGHWPLKRSDP